MASAAPASTSTPYQYRINSTAFMGILWSGTAISLCFVGVRLLSRVRSFRKLFVDDFLVIFSWTLLLVSAILWQTQQTAMYNQFKLAAGTLIPTLDVLKGEETFLKSSVALIIFYFTSLWLIKLSFLIFFRRLSSNIYRWHQIWWWCVLGFTVASYATVIGTMGFGCLLAPLTFIMTECTTKSAQDFQWQTLAYGCAIDIISDVFIITIPFTLLWNVQISLKKKLMLLGIFSLTIIVIVFSIVRVAVVTQYGATADITWLYSWSNIENIVAIIVACLASFRQLFTKSEKKASPHKVASSGSSSSSRAGLLAFAARLRETLSASGSRLKGSFARKTTDIESLPSSAGGSDEKNLFTRRANVEALPSMPPLARSDAAPFGGVYICRDCGKHYKPTDKSVRLWQPQSASP